MQSMKRFRFRLEALLDIKKRAEEEVKKELAGKNNEIQTARRQRGELAARLESFYADEKQQRLRVLNLLALRFSISYRGQLQKEIVDKDRCLANLASELDQLRVKLTQARKECKVLEMLREKKLAHWKKERGKEEQEYIDDVSQKGYVRRLHAVSRDADTVRQTG
jgi:flagellar FliJ protein